MKFSEYTLKKHGCGLHGTAKIQRPLWFVRGNCFEAMMTPLTKQSFTDPANDRSVRRNDERLSIVSNQKPSKLRAHDQSVDHEFDTFAFILAGGRGTRLHPLTVDCCKPAVPFGGSCRIIDFTLSNCINSGINRIGVLTQYRQHSLIQHLNESWSQAKRNKRHFIDVLPAQHDVQIDGYRGTADAVAQNLPILKQLAPKHTLILAGDHVYKADYRRMIRQHLKSNADVSVACCEVPASSAHRFGVVEVDRSGNIVNFEEKPRNPATLPNRADVSLISMGIYLFNTPTLITLLGSDDTQLSRSYDFGKDIFPALIKNHHVHAYDFDQAQLESYWRDIGTIDSYFDANTQMLERNPALNINDPDWPIHTHVQPPLPTRLGVDSMGHSGSISDSILANGCEINGARIRHSILFNSVTIDAETLIENSLILPGASVGKHCKIRDTIVSSGVQVPDGSESGYDPLHETLHYHVSESGIVVIADHPLSNPLPGAPTPSSRSPSNTALDEGAVSSLDQLARILN